ncbi:hypothetical protein D3C86_752110 [compost metagenome]
MRNNPVHDSPYHQDINGEGLEQHLLLGRVGRKKCEVHQLGHRHCSRAPGFLSLGNRDAQAQSHPASGAYLHPFGDIVCQKFWCGIH